MHYNFKKFITENYDILSNIGSNILQSESFAMLYDLLYKENISFPSNCNEEERELKNKNRLLMDSIINRILYYCNNCENFPCPYIIINETVKNQGNSQHFLWCSNMFYQHYLLTNDKLYYNKSKEIFEFVINNNSYKETNLIVNWINTKNYPFVYESNSNIFSIKSLTKCGLFAIFDKLDILDKQLDLIEEKMYSAEKQIYYSYYKLETNTPKPGNSCLGNNLELAEGLYDVYKITENIKYKEFAEKIIKGCLKNYKNSNYILGLLQLYNILRINKSPIDNDLQNIFDILATHYKSRGALPSFKNTKNINIFSEIYFCRCLLPINN